jgi:NAD(P)-dependent dehydrogenase (short-subunit alcohol dehydrogenase family)
VAVVTGAARGIGRGVAMLLAAEGAKVVVADFGGALDGTGGDTGPADDVVREITAAGGEAVACFADVSDEAGAGSIVDAAMDAFGQIDVLVSNAGIAAPLDWIEQLTAADYRRMVEIHYLGTVYVTQAAWPHLKASDAARLVNTTSEGILGTVPKNSSYAGGKGAVLGFTRALAVDGARDGIGVNAVLPRADTRMAAADVLSHVYDAPADMFQDLSALDPVRVSPAVAYLAHESCTLQGELIVAGGGYVVRLALVETQGIHDVDVTPETIAKNIDKILDVTDGQPMNAGVSIPSV